VGIRQSPRRTLAARCLGHVSVTNTDAERPPLKFVSPHDLSHWLG
jgi:hypothetical protein